MESASSNVDSSLSSFIAYYTVYGTSIGIHFLRGTTFLHKKYDSIMYTIHRIT